MLAHYFFIYNGNMDYKEISLNDLNSKEIIEFSGVNNFNIKLINDLFKVELLLRGHLIKVDCDKDTFLSLNKYLDALIEFVKVNHYLDENTIRQTYLSLCNNEDVSWHNKIAFITSNGKPVKYKTYNQFRLAKSLDNNDLIFSIGPAGTGKTYLAVLLACKAYKNGDIKKIILTRPAVEAGESLGFLPGDLKEKIDPYLMPLYDSLDDILGKEQVSKMVERGAIEIIPLAYMRGRTLNDAFVILDEAQNTTAGQMLMFLSRLGYNSKMIVNGDISQIDLKIDKKCSGLVVAKEKLKNINKIVFVEFDKRDNVRNPLVEKIIENYTI